MFRAALPILRAILPNRRRALAGLPLFLDYLQERQLFGNEETAKLLAEAGIARPAVPEFLDRVVDYYLPRSVSPDFIARNGA